MKNVLMPLSCAVILLVGTSPLRAQEVSGAAAAQQPAATSSAQAAQAPAAPQAPAPMPMAMPQGNLTAWPQGMMPAQQMQMQPMSGAGGGCMGGQGMSGMMGGNGGGCMGGMGMGGMNMGGGTMAMPGGQSMPMAMNQGMTIQNLVQLVTLQEIFDILDELASLEEEAIAAGAGQGREKLAKKLAGIREQIAELRRENRAQITNGSTGR